MTTGFAGEPQLAEANGSDHPGVPVLLVLRKCGDQLVVMRDHGSDALGDPRDQM